MLSSIATNPAARSLAKQAARAGLRTTFTLIRNSRQRRAANNKWYAGKRLGVPPTLQTRAISAPVTRQRQIRNNVSASAVRQTGSEWLIDVNPNVDLINGIWKESFSINPADAMTFPRLSAIASQYQKYSVSNLKVVYTPACATTQVGSVYLAIQTDPAAAPPTSTMELLGLKGAIRFAPWQPASLPIDDATMSKAFKNYIIDPSHAVQDTDPTRTVCRMILMTDKIPKGTEAGVLTLSYNVTLLDPRTDFAANSMYSVFTAASPSYVGNFINLSECEEVHPGPWTTNEEHPTFLFQRHPSAALLILRHSLTNALNVYLNEEKNTPLPVEWELEGATGRVQAWHLPRGHNRIQILGAAEDLSVHIHTTPVT